MANSTIPRKRGRSRRWLVVIGVVAVIGGALAFQGWQEQQAFDAGHAAYLQADCQNAVDNLSKVADGDGDLAVQATAEIQECGALLDADGLGQTADALLAHSVLQLKYPSGGVHDASVTKARAITGAASADTLATLQLCDELPVLEEQELIVPADPVVPPLLVACAATYEGEQQFAEALVLLDRFLENHGGHQLSQAAEDAFARVTIADADAGGPVGELPAPPRVGTSGEGNGLVKVVIQNDSPKSMSLVFNGPDVRVERLDPCTDCIEYVGAGPESCPEQGPIGEYVLQPGEYDVVVRAADDSGVTPFRGTWDLAADDEYYSCFYLVTSFP